MRLFFIICIYVFIAKDSLGNNIFDTKDYILDFKSENIISEKNYQINQIKLKSFQLILSNILTEDNYQLINKAIDPLFVNKFILNIKIKNEKIINNNYYAIIKINYNKNSIIDYLITNKINYVNYFPPKFLIIISEENEIENNSLSKNNNYYKYLFESKKLLDYNFALPNLDYNDRFLFNNDLYEKNSFNSFNEIKNKYKKNLILFVDSKKIKDTYNIKSFLFDNTDKYLITEINVKDINYKDLFFIINYKSIDKWKEINEINTSITNEIDCKININNQAELMFVSNLLKSERIINMITLKSIKYKENVYKIVYFGEIDILKKTLNRYRLKLTIQNNICSIMII